MNDPSAINDTRVRDYLDDRLQTAADLDSLDELLENVKTQQSLLQRQASLNVVHFMLDDARKEHEQAVQEANSHETALKREADAFQKQQADIDRTLMIVTQSDRTEDAVSRFQEVMSAHRKLDLATSYVGMAQQVESHRQEISISLERDPERAVAAYTNLIGLASRLGPLQEAAEGAAPHLVDYVNSTSEQARKHIFDSLGATFEATLKQMGWPKVSATVPFKLQQQWSEQIGRLLVFQQPELIQAFTHNTAMTAKTEPQVLGPLEVLVRPLALRFQYHFSGDRMTNKLDKPEYFLHHVLDLINDYAGFVNDNFQKPLIVHFGKTDLGLIPAYTDATSAWITALLPLLYRKLESILPQVARKSGLFSNLIHEVMAFDAQLQDEWIYTPLSPALPYRGLSHFVLSTLEYFPAWFAVERDFALARYEAIIVDRSAGDIDFESTESHITKPTKAAVRVNDLLETITDRYKTLAPFHQKMKFLIDIQIAIFDRFHSRLHNGLEAYLMGTSTVGRTVHGVSKSDASELTGTKGLDRLCRVYGSADYLEQAMQDWSEDVFFLQLWEELQLRTHNQNQIKGDLSMQHISAKTSNLTASSPSNDEVQGALFDETAAAYRRLRSRSEQVIVDTVLYDLRAALRAYTKVNTWASPLPTPVTPAPASSGTSSSANNTKQLSLTAELDPAVRLLDEYLSFLSRAVGRAAIRRIVTHVVAALHIQLWDSVLLRHSFGLGGVAQLRADADGLGAVVARHTGVRPDRGQGWRRLYEGLALLELPVKGAISAEAADEQGAVKRPGLWEVERRLFRSNESARDVLEELGLEVLTESEAREALKRRVELGS